MQYRIWAEMILSELHISSEEAPNTSMFIRAGGSTPKRRSNDIADALTRVADKISGVLSPSSSPKAVVSLSPARVIENRSKCYKQLAELNNLKCTGVISASEYDIEKNSVMQTFQGLKQ